MGACSLDATTGTGLHVAHLDDTGAVGRRRWLPRSLASKNGRSRADGREIPPRPRPLDPIDDALPLPAASRTQAVHEDGSAGDSQSFLLGSGGHAEDADEARGDVFGGDVLAEIIRRGPWKSSLA